MVTEGTVNADKLFTLTTNAPITLNTTALTFETMAVAAPGATTQLLYNNAGTIDSTSGITVVGSETALAFGTNPATAGTLRLANNLAGIVARNAANSADVAVLTLLSDNAVRLGNTTNAAALYLLSAGGIGEEMPSGGAHTITINGVIEYTINASTIDFNQNSITDASFIALGAIPASSGTVRLPTSGEIAARNAADSATIALLYTDASDNVIVGDFNDATALYYDVKTAGTHNFRVNNAIEYSLSATAFDMNGNTLQEVGTLDHDGPNLGFYGTAPIAKQTGVAVTAGGIHTALVNLGLIAA
jgi:hypothetical protein